MPKSFNLGGQMFASKKAVVDKCREILYRYEPGEPLSQVDHDFLFDILRLHPKADEKIGPGVRQFYTVQQQFSKCFFVRRTDNSEIDFSFNKCLK